ncbi:MAG TPA: hypothetical protein VGC66_14020 [Pyrinomonadaceae bacterium]|jgi:hypothetical protein
MKRCPTCNRKYVDEDLNYCLADGSFLLTPSELQQPEAPPTVKITDAPTEVITRRQSDLPTEVMPGATPATNPDYKRATAPAKSFGSAPWIIAYLAICTVIIAGVVLFIGDRRKENSDSTSSMNANSFTGNSATTSTNKGAVSTYATPTPTSTPTASPTEASTASLSLRKITGMSDLSGTYTYDRIIGIESDTPFNASDYTSRREGNDFTVVIRNATTQGSRSLGGGGAIDSVELQQRDSDVVLLVKAKEGTKTWVWRNNAILLVQIGLKK